MSNFYFPKKQKPNPMPIILLGGFILGIVLGRFLFMEQQSPVSPAPSRTPIFSATASITSTPFPAKAVEITPKVNIQSIARVGQPAPDFSLQTIDGKEIRLSELQGNAVLINMWASWCPPCRDEMPAIQAAYEKYKDKGLVVLGIDFMVQDNLPDVNAFIQELGLTFPILLDETGEVSAGLYGMRALPTSYFVDTEGVIQRIQVGAMTPEMLEEYLAEILLK